jgi:hypothetical protein
MLLDFVSSGTRRRMRRRCLSGGRFPNYPRRESSVGCEAAFDFASFNGRALGDDVMDVIINLASNAATANGVAADQGRIRADFP